MSISDNREWATASVPGWAASRTLPTLDGGSLFSTAETLPGPHELRLLNGRDAPPPVGARRRNHADARVRRWQARGPTDAEGTFASVHATYHRSLRAAPDYSIVKHHRDLRIAALVRQAVKEGHGGGDLGDPMAAKAARRGLQVRARFAKHNFSLWGEAVLRAVADGDVAALRRALDQPGVDVDERVRRALSLSLSFSAFFPPLQLSFSLSVVSSFLWLSNPHPRFRPTHSRLI